MSFANKANNGSAQGSSGNKVQLYLIPEVSVLNMPHGFIRDISPSDKNSRTSRKTNQRKNCKEDAQIAAILQFLISEQIHLR